MKKILLTVILNITFSIVTFAASPMDMRFHCENDTNKINTLLNEGLKSNLKTSNELVVFYANKLLGTPYVAHTLEGETEQLTINIDELDCTTFIETLYVLTRTTLSNRTSWRDYANNLESVRYRNGVIGDYSSRLHYISEWIINNSSRDNLKDITPDFSKSSRKRATVSTSPKYPGSRQADQLLFGTVCKAILLFPPFSHSVKNKEVVHSPVTHHLF